VKRERPAKPGKAASKRPYHHGALRKALLDVAESLVEERGVEGFTLRECARRAGVSHGAPAHHFGDATGLLTELSSLGFEELDALMTRYREEGSHDRYAQFVATGLAYVDYALEHPARFQLMFRSDKLNFTDSRLSEAASRTYRQLEETLGMLSRKGADGGLSLNERAALAWSIVHGFAALTLENERFAKSMGSSPSRARATLGRMLLASKDVFARDG
jgi:AcrR family transcriptional regulator